MAENRWRTVGENQWRIVGENTWRSLGENRWRIIGRKVTLIVPSLPQSYDVLFIFFKRGDYFSQFVLMMNTKVGLDVYWQMVQSLQFPGTTPAENEIPAEIIRESYQHVGNHP